ncbi:hypothetical protein SDC9_172669 [bioreactor metagenome]|uniref:Uncharacterized protein n=1 Tax=bioreactor metagenome TaxID=1076179 RepID=A0A645GH07_9ZZZZ
MLVGHIGLENLLDVVGNAEQHLATAKDLCYASHGSTLLLCVCGNSHYKGLSGPFLYISPDLGLCMVILFTPEYVWALQTEKITTILLFCKTLSY